ncbi:hypothetical protein CAC42_7660 [Sphaceloma murrayae]|uniref:Cysteine-rich PDZ-binding protein n=1 Tax=Sphaceloma murrayae TaxID=2082308 RepID=A0A2K1QTD1_9PEZI|nr:hypothetical protein CAC42_7660 [Sphaceloma murrayae]
MVCAKCSRLAAKTKLATPEVKTKNTTSSSSSSSFTTGSAGSSKGSSSSTLGQNGVGKSKLLSKAAKNPYATYASNCGGCSRQVESGRKYCQRCAYGKQVCAVCGKKLAGGDAGSSKAPVISGQKYTQK